MTKDCALSDETATAQSPSEGCKTLPAAAERALAEAAERRRLLEAASKHRPAEIDGRDGLEPVRYGDWEVKGIATDF